MKRSWALLALAAAWIPMLAFDLASSHPPASTAIRHTDIPGPPTELVDVDPFLVTAVQDTVFRIDLVSADGRVVYGWQEIQRAARRWEQLLRPTRPQPIQLPQGWSGCAPYTVRAAQGRAVRNILFVVIVRPIDGVGGALAAAAPVSIRIGGLPATACFTIDEADLPGMVNSPGKLYNISLHEMAHGLGLGTSMWERKGLIRNASTEATIRDTHFAGPVAVRQFGQIGAGDNYHGARVPVENRMGPGSRNSHWRENGPMGCELMSPIYHPNDPITTVTIGSFIDLGYRVDIRLADPFRRPIPGRGCY